MERCERAAALLEKLLSVQSFAASRRTRAEIPRLRFAKVGNSAFCNEGLNFAFILVKESERTMPHELWLFLGFAALYFLLVKFVLPRLGVPT
jgi:hypothetical protein